MTLVQCTFISVLKLILLKLSVVLFSPTANVAYSLTLLTQLSKFRHNACSTYKIQQNSKLNPNAHAISFAAYIQRALFYIPTLFTSENFTLLPFFTTCIRRHFREVNFLSPPPPPSITNVVYIKTSIFCSLEVLMHNKSFVYYMKRKFALHRNFYSTQKL
jgi:hypothetical protein